jgi:hypothetical protein
MASSLIIRCDDDSRILSQTCLEHVKKAQDIEEKCMSMRCTALHTRSAGVRASAETSKKPHELDEALE